VDKVLEGVSVFTHKNSGCSRKGSPKILCVRVCQGGVNLPRKIGAKAARD